MRPLIKIGISPSPVLLQPTDKVITRLELRGDDAKSATFCGDSYSGKRNYLKQT